MASEVPVTDGVGRSLNLHAPANRLVFIGSLAAEAFLLVHPDPRRIIVGATPDVYDLFKSGEGEGNGQSAYPKKVIIGVGATISVESIVKLAPDLIVLPNDDAAYGLLLSQLNKLDLPYAFLARSGPQITLAEQARSQIIVAGRVVGREQEAQRYLEFYDQKYATILQRLVGIPKRSKVLVEMHADYAKPSYITWGRSNLDIGQALGAESVGSRFLSAESGTLSAESVLVANPDIYIASVGHSTSIGTIVAIGPDVDRATTRETLRKAMSRRGLSGTTAARTGNIHVVSHALTYTPLNIAIFEVVAKWLYPEVFWDIEPGETLRSINSRFRKPPLRGFFWASLDPVKREAE